MTQILIPLLIDFVCFIIRLKKWIDIFSGSCLPFLIANKKLVNFYRRQHFIFQLIFYSVRMCLHDLTKMLILYIVFFLQVWVTVANQNKIVNTSGPLHHTCRNAMMPARAQQRAFAREAFKGHWPVVSLFHLNFFFWVYL